MTKRHHTQSPIDTARIGESAIANALDIYAKHGEVRATLMLIGGGIPLVLQLGAGGSEIMVEAVRVLAGATRSRLAVYANEAYWADSHDFDTEPGHGELQPLAESGDPRVLTAISVLVFDLFDPTNDYAVSYVDHRPRGGELVRSEHHGLLLGGLAPQVEHAVAHPFSTDVRSVPGLLAGLTIKGVITAAGTP